MAKTQKISAEARRPRKWQKGRRRKGHRQIFPIRRRLFLFLNLVLKPSADRLKRPIRCGWVFLCFGELLTLRFKVPPEEFRKSSCCRSSHAALPCPDRF